MATSDYHIKIACVAKALGTVFYNDYTKRSDMKLKRSLMIAALASLGSLPAFGATLVVNQDFSSNPPLCTTSGSVGVNCYWYGAQHGVGGPSSTFAWANFAGSGGANGFVGYSPVNRGGVTFLTTDFAPLPFQNLLSVQVDAKNSSTSNANQLALRASNGQWYVSDYGVSATSGSWQTIVFDLTSGLMFQPYSTDLGSNTPPNVGITPDTSTGPSQLLPNNLIINAIGIFNSWSGMNSPSSGYVLRYDNFIVSAVPEPATFALMMLGLAGFGFSRQRKASIKSDLNKD